MKRSLSLWGFTVLALSFLWLCPQASFAEAKDSQEGTSGEVTAEKAASALTCPASSAAVVNQPATAEEALSDFFGAVADKNIVLAWSLLSASSQDKIVSLYCDSPLREAFKEGTTEEQVRGIVRLIFSSGMDVAGEIFWTPFAEGFQPEVFRSLNWVAVSNDGKEAHVKVGGSTSEDKYFIMLNEGGQWKLDMSSFFDDDEKEEAGAKEAGANKEEKAGAKEAGPDEEEKADTSKMFK